VVKSPLVSLPIGNIKSINKAQQNAGQCGPSCISKQCRISDFFWLAEAKCMPTLLVLALCCTEALRHSVRLEHLANQQSNPYIRHNLQPPPHTPTAHLKSCKCNVHQHHPTAWRVFANRVQVSCHSVWDSPTAAVGQNCS